MGLSFLFHLSSNIGEECLGKEAFKDIGRKKYEKIIYERMITLKNRY